MKEKYTDSTAQFHAILSKAIPIYEGCERTCEKVLKSMPKEKLEVLGGHFYIWENGKRKYLSCKEQARIHTLSNKDYYTKLQKVVVPQLALLKRLETSLSQSDPASVYERLHPAKQSFVTPLFQSDEDFAKAWQEAPYPHDDRPNTRYLTERGDYVRSKSEILIANALYAASIPYRYEEEVNIPGYGMVHPDFTVLNPKTREVFYWEHFGMMDDIGYKEKTALKMEGYYRAGILPNHLLATFESGECPLSIIEIKRIIRDYLQ